MWAASMKERRPWWEGGGLDGRAEAFCWQDNYRNISVTCLVSRRSTNVASDDPEAGHIGDLEINLGNLAMYCLIVPGDRTLKIAPSRLGAILTPASNASRDGLKTCKFSSIYGYLSRSFTAVWRMSGRISWALDREQTIEQTKIDDVCGTVSQIIHTQMFCA